MKEAVLDVLSAEDCEDLTAGLFSFMIHFFRLKLIYIKEIIINFGFIQI